MANGITETYLIVIYCATEDICRPTEINLKKKLKEKV
jgi:hypothetical protein